jgi:succinate-acetate transporter protein
MVPLFRFLWILIFGSFWFLGRIFDGISIKNDDKKNNNLNEAVFFVGFEHATFTLLIFISHLYSTNTFS